MTMLGLRNGQWIRLVQIFSAKMVLEVFGGAGAIWGFSEAVGLRHPSTIWFWRPCALIIGAVFFVRWMMQIQDFIDENKSKRLGTFHHEMVKSETDELPLKNEDDVSYGST
mmetsp:Transcript_48/g.57  ORF Transcript_48/g.57 Transcript_48/m.57 type:complete len:111 (+) Transcript_48:185-517(+)|eukprot:CAMPEP_0197233026 /NCGR_PEP_ID=MMETSP1429-20130617/1205_1 /TAXON_ID=49237 /ORGANISM="Chaetoceros  sp., Strain UNC1202" /LENGTH=110 /DNA_ID=CAMNT_0042691203 /DNA_START=165 /DNA_END=497 /DNA_ORIENTATION=-